MTNEQKRIEVYNALNQLLGGFMVQNQVSASTMEDALNKCLVSIKDQVLQEFINAAVQESEQIAQQQQMDSLRIVNEVEPNMTEGDNGE